MKLNQLLLFLLFMGLINPLFGSFKSEQLKFKRVKNAYEDKYQELRDLWKEKKVDSNHFCLKIRAIKSTKQFFLISKDIKGKEIILTEFPICELSGGKGSKCEEGDGQVPEGNYYIERFNPQSNFHLSLGINYPNKNDMARCGKKSFAGMGGDIFIHGSCVSIGCLALTDKVIKLVYIACIEALDRNPSQKRIPVEIVW